MKKIIRLTEGDLHKIVKESVNKILSEIGDTSRGHKMLGWAYHKANKANDIKGDIITCCGTIEQINGVAYSGGGNLFGNGIYLKVGYTPENNPYGIISVNVDVSNFYRAKDTQDALAIAKNNKESYSGILYHSHHDGDVCVVFDKNCIIGKA